MCAMFIKLMVMHNQRLHNYRSLLNANYIHTSSCICAAFVVAQVECLGLTNNYLVELTFVIMYYPSK